MGGQQARQSQGFADPISGRARAVPLDAQTLSAAEGAGSARTQVFSRSGGQSLWHDAPCFRQVVMEHYPRRNPALANTASALAEKLGITVLDLDDPLLAKVDHHQPQLGGLHAARSGGRVDDPKRPVVPICLLYTSDAA